MTEQHVIDAIVAGLASVAGINAVQFYTEEMRESDISGETPLILLEQNAGQPADDFGVDGIAQQMFFSAVVCVRANATDSIRDLHRLTTLVAEKIKNTRWALDDLGLANISDVTWEDMRPDLPQYRTMQIDFNHHAFLES